MKTYKDNFLDLTDGWFSLDRKANRTDFLGCLGNILQDNRLCMKILGDTSDKEENEKW